MIRVEQQTPKPNEPQIPCIGMRAREAAKALGVSERTLWQWAAEGIIPHVRIGKVRLFPADVIRRWLSEQAQTVNGENNGPERNLRKPENGP